MRLMVAAAALVAVLAGCGGSAAPTTPPATSTPAVTPAPTVAPTAQPTASPTPTPEPTPVPTPRATPKPIESITDAEHPSVTWSAVRKRLVTLVAEQPIDPYTPNALEGWDECMRPTGHAPDAGNQIGCMLTVHNAYRIYKKTGNEEYWKTAFDAYSYASSYLGRDQMDAMDEYLEKHN